MQEIANVGEPPMKKATKKISDVRKIGFARGKRYAMYKRDRSVAGPVRYPTFIVCQ